MFFFLRDGFILLNLLLTLLLVGHAFDLMVRSSVKFLATLSNCDALPIHSVSFFIN